jgi:hypothetical protein
MAPYLLFVFIAIAGSEFCGSDKLCICKPWTRSITCFSREIQQFPTFNKSITSSASLVEILNTSIQYLPHFDIAQWPMLDMLILEDNIFLNCSSIYKYRSRHPGLYVVSNCGSAPALALTSLTLMLKVILLPGASLEITRSITAFQ